MRKHLIVVTLLALTGIVLALAQAQPPKPAQGEDPTLRQATEAYLAAFNKGDLDGLMAFWAADADYVDDAGKAHKGREAIKELFKKAMADLKGYQLKRTKSSVRFLKPDVAVEDGVVELTSPEGATESSPFTAFWTKTDGKWQLSSVRDMPNQAETAGANRLQGLQWLLGEWTHADGDTSVAFTCRWALNNRFLVQEYVVKRKGGSDLTVTQYLGWDPTAQQLKTWFFDSSGGFGEARWSRRGNTWTGQATGVVADGRIGSATHSFKQVDENTFLWQSSDRQLQGEGLPDADVKFVRKQAGK